MRLSRRDFVPLLTIVAGGAIGASLSFSFLGRSPSADVRTIVPIVATYESYRSFEILRLDRQEALAKARALTAGTLEAVVLFDYDEATITAASERLLRAKLPILRNSPTVRLRLEGHADERGSTEYNLALGSRRAESVREFLAGFGISADRITLNANPRTRP